MKKMKTEPVGKKRVVVISDLHAGSKVGLTPKDWIQHEDSEYGRIQLQLLDSFEGLIEPYLNPDLLIVNGDAIDGTGERKGGIEQITTNRLEQVEMAGELINSIGAKKVIVIHGTPYHTGKEEDFEELLPNYADNVERVGMHEFIDVNGVIFDCKHHCAGSSVPQGRHSAVAKERMWNYMWTEFGEHPKSDVILRSHVHYFSFCGASSWIGMTTPCLQAGCTSYGVKKMSGTIDFGFVHFDVAADSTFTWDSHIVKLNNWRNDVVRI